MIARGLLLFLGVIVVTSSSALNAGTPKAADGSRPVPATGNSGPANEPIARELAESQRQNLILQASNEIEDKAYARFELGMGGLGLLITLLVIVFGFRTEKAAARAAQAELADRKKEIDELLVIARQAAAAAETSASLAAGHEGATATIVARVEESSRVIEEAAKVANQLSIATVAGRAPEITENQRAAVEAGALEATNQREADLSVDQFKARVAKAYLDRDWNEVIRLTRGMAFVHPADRESRSYATFQEAYALSMLGRSQEAVNAYQRHIEEFRDDSDTKIRERSATAMLNQGYEFGKLGAGEDELRAYEEVISKFGADQGAEIQETVAMAITNKAITYDDRGDHANALENYEIVVSRYGQASEIPVQRVVAKAWFNRGCKYGALGRTDDEVRTYDELVSTFKEAHDTDLRELVAKSLVNKGVALLRAGNLAASISIFKTLLEDLKDSTDEPLIVQSVMAKANMGLALRESGEFDNSVICLDEVIFKYLNSDVQSLREWAELAIFYKAESYARSGQIEKCIETLDDWSRTKSFDCNSLSGSKSLETIRDDKRYRDFLSRVGCAGERGDEPEAAIA